MLNVLDPNRAIYRKKIKKARACEFCDKKNISEQGIKRLFGKHWMVLVNKYPYMDGNVMIIPKRHVTDIIDLTQDEWEELKEMFDLVKTELRRRFKTASFNIGLNINRLAGASIDHLHWQVIPRTEKILNSSNIFGRIQVITMEPKKLKKILDKI